jgi:L-lactate utilization protein LutB
MNYDTLASKDSIQKTITALKERGHLPELVETRAEALQRIKELIPQGASVMNGSSRTLEEIGFVDYLKEGKHGWNNLHAAILAETDAAKQAALRKQSVLSDYYLGSAHAVAETGEMLIASNSGSQLPHIVFTSQNLIFVIGAQKIAPTLADAFDRLEKYVVPLEGERTKKVMGVGTYASKILIINKEQPFMGRKSHVILVNEKLGF